MSFRDHHSRAATAEYKQGWDRMYEGRLDLSMSRYLDEGRPEETFWEWKLRRTKERVPDFAAELERLPNG